MNTKKVLLGCTVISLQDTRFAYPCCKVCLCRVKEESNSRSRCAKCGITYDTQNVDYRFRLSLKVFRDTRLFGVTVFGGCLNPFFGITAGGLQSFVESETFNGPPSLQQLLIKAVEDCFIGKCFVFGFKLSSRDAESCLLGKHAADESVQLVACQVIPPHGDLLGVTVFAYLQSLMKVNAPADCSPYVVRQWQKKDSLVSSFEQTLPLCQKSCSARGNDSLAIPPPWDFVSNLDLCFSPAATRECSVPEASVKSNDSQESLVSRWSNGGKSAKYCPFPLSESKRTVHNRLSTFQRSRFNASFISPIKMIPSDQSSNRLPANQGAVKDCFCQINTSFFEKPLVNLEDGPLSETLGEFVSTDLQIVNQKVLSSFTSKRTPGALETSALLENYIIPSDPPLDPSLHSSFPVLTPLCGVANDEKSLKSTNGKRKSSSASKPTTKLSHVSKRLLSCDIKDVLPNKNGGAPLQNHATKKDENQPSGNEDDYNCSADLFHQSSMNIVDESSFSDTDLKKKDHFADIKVSEPNILSFHFAPSLQSTPIVDTDIECAYRQRKLNKKWSGSHWSRKSVTRTSLLRAMQNHTNSSQGLQLANHQFNRASGSAFESFKSSADGSEQKENMKHTPGDSTLPTVTNDCSKDLFDSSF